MRQPTKVFAHDAGPWDLIIASFSFNEAFEAAEEGEAEALAWLRWQLANLAPGGLLLILEPASKIASERLMSARDALVLAEEAHVWAPCLHQAACPMLGGKAWCHEVRSWPIPDHMKWLNRRMFRAIEHLKFGFVALGREAPSPLSTAGLPMRLVGPLSQMKGRWLTSGCVANGELWRLEIQKRQLHAATKALYKRTKRGDLMQVLAPEEEAAALAPHPHSGLIRLPKSAQLVPLNVKEPE